MYYFLSHEVVTVVRARQPKAFNEEGASWVSTSGLPGASGVVTVVATRRPEAPASEVVMPEKHRVARG